MRPRPWAIALLLTAAAGCSRDWDGLSVQGADAQSGGAGGGSAGSAGATGGFGNFGASGGSAGTSATGGFGNFGASGGSAGTSGSGGTSGNDGGSCQATTVGATCETVWGSGQGGPCADCMIANCCDETTACFNSEACTGLLECISSQCASSPEPACVEKNCAACLNQSAIDAYNAIDSCQQANCGSAC